MNSCGQTQVTPNSVGDSLESSRSIEIVSPQFPQRVNLKTNKGEYLSDPEKWEIRSLPKDVKGLPSDGRVPNQVFAQGLSSQFRIYLIQYRLKPKVMSQRLLLVQTTEQKNETPLSLTVGLNLPQSEFSGGIARWPIPEEKNQIYFYTGSGTPNLANCWLNADLNEALRWETFHPHAQVHANPKEFPIVECVIPITRTEIQPLLNYTYEKTSDQLPRRFGHRKSNSGLTWEIQPEKGRLSETAIFTTIDKIRDISPTPAQFTMELSQGWEREVRRGGRDKGLRATFPEGFPPVASTLKLRGVESRLWVYPFGVKDSEARKNSSGLLKDKEEKLLRPSNLVEGIEVDLGDAVIDPSSLDGKLRLSRWAKNFTETHGAAVSGLRLGYLGELYKFYTSHFLDLEISNGNPKGRPKKIALETLRMGLRSLRAALPPKFKLLGDWNTPEELLKELDGSRPHLRFNFEGDLLRREALTTISTLSSSPGSSLVDGLHFDLGMEGHPGGLSQLGAFQALIDLKVLTGKGITLLGPSSPKAYEARLLKDRFRRIERALRQKPIKCLSPRDVREEPPQIWLVENQSDKGSAFTVGLFNWESRSPRRLRVDLKALGIPHHEAGYWIYDRHSWNLLGRSGAGDDLVLDFWLPARSSKLISLHPDSHEVTRLGDSTHWMGSTKFESETPLASLKNDRLNVAFQLEKGWPENRPLVLDYLLASDFSQGTFEVQKKEGVREIQIEKRGRHLKLQLNFIDAPWVKCELVYQPATSDSLPPLQESGKLNAAFHTATQGVWLSWDYLSDQPETLRGYRVFRNGEQIGQTFGRTFLDRLPGSMQKKGSTVDYSVIPWSDPKVELLKLKASYIVEAPSSILLSELLPERVEALQQPQYRLSQTGRVLLPGGVGISLPTTLEYQLNGRYAFFDFKVQIDRDAPLWARAKFRIELDGKKIWESDDKRFGDSPVGTQLVVRGGKKLTLIAEHLKPGAKEALFASWLEAQFIVD